MTIYDFLPKFIKRIIADRPRQTITAEYWNEMFNLLVAQGDWGQEAIQIIMNKLSEDVLLKSNTDAWVPTTNFQPATRKFVTDQISYMGGGDMLKSIYDVNNAGIVDNASRLAGELPTYFATASALNAHIEAYNTMKGANDTKNNEQDSSLTTLNTDVAKYKLTQQYPMKVISYSSPPAVRAGGDYTLATIPLERIYNYATIEYTIGHFDSSGNAQADASTIFYLRNFVITPGFLQNGRYDKIDGDVAYNIYQGRVKQIGNVTVVYNGWSSAPECLGIEQVGTNLLIKVYEEKPNAYKSYLIYGKLW